MQVEEIIERDAIPCMAAETGMSYDDLKKYEEDVEEFNRIYSAIQSCYKEKNVSSGSKKKRVKPQGTEGLRDAGPDIDLAVFCIARYLGHDTGNATRMAGDARRPRGRSRCRPRSAGFGV